MSTKPRINLVLSPEQFADLQEISADSRASMANVCRMAIALYKVYHQAKKEGHYIGISKDPKRLERQLVAMIP
jgi:hypothetical protein